MDLPALPPQLTAYDPRSDIIAALQKSQDVTKLVEKLFGEYVKDQVITEELGRQEGSVTKAEGGLTNQDRADYDSHDLVATQISQQPSHVSDDIILRYGADYPRLLDMSNEDRMEAHNKGGELADPLAEAKRIDAIAEEKLNERAKIGRELTTHYVNAAEAMFKSIGIEYEKQTDTNAFIFKRSDLQKILDLVHHEKSKFVGETAPVITDFLEGKQTLAEIVAERPFTQRMAAEKKQLAASAAR